MPELRSWNPPHLPDPRRDADFHGIIHLHGCLDKSYRFERDGELVLSSADFGKAYLSDGWATIYVRSLLERFKIVFVGYRAEDPPVEYLLEALKVQNSQCGLYAFQPGDSPSALEQWRRKGVQAIPYDGEGHSSLWSTLRNWAERARNVDAWTDRVIANALEGPAPLAPFERGQVAHLARTVVGAKALAKADKTIPATWLFVFDKTERYGRAGRIDPVADSGPFFDPFDAFGLDDDEAPSPPDPDNWLQNREVPSGSWDAFAPTEVDRGGLSLTAVAHFHGSDAGVAPLLPPRLAALGEWFLRVAERPEALWWAAGKYDLHPRIKLGIDWALRREPERFGKLLEGWRSVLEAWGPRADGYPHQAEHTIVDRIKTEGWHAGLVRDLIALYRPRLKIERSFRAHAPSSAERISLNEILRSSIDYPRPYSQPKIPTEYLALAVQLMRGHLQLASEMEAARGFLHLESTWPENGEALDETTYGISGLVFTFIHLMARLVQEDRRSAREEFRAWSGRGDDIFTRLRIWAATRKDLLSPSESGRVFLSIPSRAFWSSTHERDLLLGLSDRWVELPNKTRLQLQKRFFSAPIPLPIEEKHKAFVRLNRLHWLSTHGVAFTLDLERRIDELRKVATDWEPRYGDHAADANTSGIYSVQQETDPTPLLNVPLGQILPKAEEEAGLDIETHVRRDPFVGLALLKPVRVLAELTRASTAGTVRSRAWSTFLGLATRSDDSPRMITLIAHRLARLELSELRSIAYESARWLEGVAPKILPDCEELFSLVWRALIRSLRLPTARRKPPSGEWANTAISSAAGTLVDALFEDSRRSTLHAGDGLPSIWIQSIDQLLDLPSEDRAAAIVMLAFRLNWLFAVDVKWTQKRLLSLLDNQDPHADEVDAFWSGFFWRANTPSQDLYPALKPHLIRLAKGKPLGRRHSDVLGGVLLAGWRSPEGASEPLISDHELHEILVHADEELRGQIMFHLEQWSTQEPELWADKLLPFLVEVWPRQKALRTPRDSARLADLALSHPDLFPEIVNAILPHIVPIQDTALWTTPWLDEENQLVLEHPVNLLDLLWAILPEDVSNWPYRTEAVLEGLTNQTGTEDDPRLTELKRRWRYR